MPGCIVTATNCLNCSDSCVEQWLLLVSQACQPIGLLFRSTDLWVMSPSRFHCAFVATCSAHEPAGFSRGPSHHALCCALDCTLKTPNEAACTTPNSSIGQQHSGKKQGRRQQSLRRRLPAHRHGLRAKPGPPQGERGMYNVQQTVVCWLPPAQCRQREPP